MRRLTRVLDRDRGVRDRRRRAARSRAPRHRRTPGLDAGQTSGLDRVHAPRRDRRVRRLGRSAGRGRPAPAHRSPLEPGRLQPATGRRTGPASCSSACTPTASATISTPSRRTGRACAGSPTAPATAGPTTRPRGRPTDGASPSTVRPARAAGGHPRRSPSTSCARTAAGSGELSTAAKPRRGPLPDLVAGRRDDRVQRDFQRRLARRPRS